MRPLPKSVTLLKITATALLALVSPLAAASQQKAHDAARYVVIDLSAGVNASSYPVSYLADVPEGGWTDVHKTSMLVLRLIEPGTFMMGSPTDELGKGPDETLHQVTLNRAYYMGVFEVTQRQWELVMGANNSFFVNPADYPTRPVEKVTYVSICNTDWPSNPQPNANSFSGRLRSRTKFEGFNLPTEAQWEYAARAGSPSSLTTGKNISADSGVDPELSQLGRFVENGGSVGSDKDAAALMDASRGTAKVGSYKPNAWGLYDVHGNVWERCLDLYEAEFGSSPVIDPVGPASNGTGYRMMKGGGFSSNRKNCRLAVRYDKDPAAASRDYGFRIAIHLSDGDGDGFFSNVPTSHPAADPDDVSPYRPFLDENANFVPDNFGNDASNPLPDHHPDIALRLEGTAVLGDLRVSVGPVYSIETSDDAVNWTAIPFMLNGQQITFLEPQEPATLPGISLPLPSSQSGRILYRLRADLP